MENNGNLGLKICFTLYLLNFSLTFTGQYLNLDSDHNGMLSKDELLKYVIQNSIFYISKESIQCPLSLDRYGSGTLTKVFVDRVFQECLTYEGEMVQYK